MSDNWYAPASMVIQLSFLIAGVWFARNILRAIRASQEQLGAMLKFSIAGVTAEWHSSTVNANESLAADSRYCRVPSETEAAGRAQPTESGPGRFAIARRKIALWLQAPMSSSEAAPWRRVINWLQAAAGS
jgi:hypothetical protein